MEKQGLFPVTRQSRDRIFLFFLQNPKPRTPQQSPSHQPPRHRSVWSDGLSTAQIACLGHRRKEAVSLSLSHVALHVFFFLQILPRFIARFFPPRENPLQGRQGGRGRRLGFAEMKREEEDEEEVEVSSEDLEVEEDNDNEEENHDGEDEDDDDDAGEEEENDDDDVQEGLPGDDRITVQSVGNEEDDNDDEEEEEEAGGGDDGVDVDEEGEDDEEDGEEEV